ncbi:ABC transporter permease subunit [Bordetella pseudohinzii]|uniref:Inner membrane ABC transporter permease protein ydcV n=1 Tax=Bordetella pseudohinzii TaxID=1331258 RepID=A0A0J6BZD5_9BORD|nr:ABC transporter permease subunit [Bordetella pseudohinzii]ANY15664.1 putrescine ABC transporter permease PotI [Bordetella pseudohinzii]KMM27009.1 spermidine/putrescine ABC transporter permease [Bordetella pseudohinzii]KXA78256.1 spermidine/putrescine ABC transporter permease [Bordetella pseudohinzii]KXA82383.1 spermidine/putrescine ABC transporter permease [Bordetella pseudohinzii]CUI55013.1 Inner membrane ABC transporter permease protein ydcV [Bordetella pseudohinzii]
MKGPNKTLRYAALGVGYFFLYVPILSLMVFSFNDSPVVTSWTGFSLRWYGSLFNDDALLRAAWLSFKIAALTATAATIIGTWAGYVLARMGRFKGFGLYVGMLSAPLVIPEVVLGISLLLMFVEMRGHLGWPAQNGIFTIWVGHVTLCMAFVAVVIQSRIRDMDRSLEEAALDLGATPIKVFFAITLPLIAPALASAWLLSFTLSLDDVVLASFLSGPGYSTLPMEVFSRVRLGLKPEVNALATLFILAVGTCVIIANRMQARRETQT